jgi:hypothetical protein
MTSTDDAAPAANGDARPGGRAVFGVVEGGIDPIRRLGTAVELLRQAADMGLSLNLLLFENGERRLALGGHLRELTPEMVQQLRDYEREITTILDVTKNYHCSLREGSPSSEKARRHGSYDVDPEGIPF